VQFRYGTTGKCFFSPPRRQHFREKFFRRPFQYPKVPLEAGAPQSFDASYAPAWVSLRHYEVNLTGGQTQIY
jgi:hypothetical protein